VSRIESATTTLGGLTMARTSAGRIGMAYDDVIPVSTEGLHIASFLAPASSGVAPLVEVATTGYTPMSTVGRVSAIAAGGPGDVLSVVYVDEDAEELHYQELAGGGTSLSPVELVASGIGSGSYVSLAVSPSGEIRAAYYVPSLGAVSSAARASAGGFEMPSEVVTGLVANVPGTGQSALVLDADETPNLLYQSCTVMSYSTPVYTTFDGANWSLAKTVDNNILNAAAGYSPSLVVFGATKYAAYFYVPTDQSVPFLAALHLASWQTYADTPSIEILDPGVPASDPGGDTETFRFGASLAVDGYGLLHLAVVRPGAVSGTASVEYVRQAWVGGAITWLTDIVDDDVLAADLTSEAPNAFASIVVDGAARPHIGYRSGKDGNVYYATRFDR
jgi:hypothetical protein